jgi:hypothetical protein
MKIFTTLAIVLVIWGGGAVKAEGLPLPWPFPWAKECPMNWQALNGQYLLSDAAESDTLDVSISTYDRVGVRVVRVARYTGHGELIYQGFSTVTENQRTIRLSLLPANGTDCAVQAVIKLHFQSSVNLCSMDHLVPILTIMRGTGASPKRIQYKMVKIENFRN